MKEESSG